MIVRNKRFSLYLSEREEDQLFALASAHDRSVNAYVRMLIRQAVNKSTVELELPPRRRRTRKEVEYTI